MEYRRTPWGAMTSEVQDCPCKGCKRLAQAILEEDDTKVGLRLLDAMTLHQTRCPQHRYQAHERFWHER